MMGIQEMYAEYLMGELLGKHNTGRKPSKRWVDNIKLDVMRTRGEWKWLRIVSSGGLSY